MAGLGASRLAAPALARAQGSSTLRFMPRFDAGVLDPHGATSGTTRTHAFLVYEALYGMTADQQPQPQVVEGYTVADEG